MTKTLSKKNTAARLMTFVIIISMLATLMIGMATQVFAERTEKVDDKEQNTWFYTIDDSDVCTAIKVIDANGSEVTDLTGLTNPKGWEVGQSVKTSVQKTDDQLDEIVDGLNVHADLGAAQQTLSGLTKIVNTVIGVLATIILIAIGFFTAVDILYLEVPALHNKMDEGAMNSGSTNKSGGVKPKLVSEDASQAFNDASQAGKNPLIIYLKKRIVAYIAVSIVLFMLLSGNLALIVKVVLKALNGVFGWVEEFAES